MDAFYDVWGYCCLADQTKMMGRKMKRAQELRRKVSTQVIDLLGCRGFTVSYSENLGLIDKQKKKHHFHHNAPFLRSLRNVHGLETPQTAQRNQDFSED